MVVMFDYYADWCVSCKEMERFTFTDPAVQAALANVLLLQTDVTGNDTRDRALLDEFGLFGPPAIQFFGPDGARAGASCGWWGTWTRTTSSASSSGRLEPSMAVQRVPTKHGWTEIMMRFLAMLVLVAAATTGVRADSHLVDFSLLGRGRQGAPAVGLSRQVGRHQLLGDLVRAVHGRDPRADATSTSRHKDDDAVVIGVNFEEIETPDLVKFIDEMAINYLGGARTATPRILPFEPLKGLPSTFFVDPQRRVRREPLSDR